MTSLTLSSSDASLGGFFVGRVNELRFHFLGSDLPRRYAMMDWYGDGSGWMNGGGFFFMAFFVISIVGLVAWIVTRNSGGK